MYYIIIIIFPKKIHYKVHLTYESLFLLHMKRYHVSKKSFRFLCLDFGKKTSLMTCFLRFSNLKLSWQSYNPCESQEFPYQSYLKPVNCAMIGMHCSISSLLISKHSGWLNLCHLSRWNIRKNKAQNWKVTNHEDSM
jgi:hypothetical protein